MKKNYLFLLLSILCFQAKAQIVNESASWPNAAWTVTGDYNTDPLAFESDPTTTPNFAFDDDDAGTGHEDNIAAESPVIDLTAAFNGGEKSLEITVMYGYRYLANDKLIFQYWDADGGVWVDWGTTIPNTGASVGDGFCALPKVLGSSGILGIGAFTPNQLSNFRYRISYDDDPAAADFNWGFCFDSPTLQSLVCGAPNGIVAANVGGSSADLSWNPINDVIGYQYVLDNTDADPAGAGTNITDNFYMASGLDFETQYYFHVRTACTNGLSPWRTVEFTTSPPPPVNDEPAGALELLLDLGTACGPNKITGIANMDTSGSSAEIDPTCMDQYNPSQGNGDLWFYFVAPTTPVTLDTSDITGNIFSVSTALYSGTPGNFTEVGVCGNAATKTYSDLVPGDTYYYRMWDYGNDGIGTWSLCGYYLDCTMPAATYTKISNCPTTEEFFVDVEITDMGTATSLTISDDQGSATQQATVTGVFNFGPYAMNTPVVFTIANDQSAACTITSPSQNIVACPPSNDTCQTATDLGTLTSPITDTTEMALNDNLSICNSAGTSVVSNAVDVYYFINVPAGSTLTIGQTNNTYDSAIVVFYGDCDNPTQINCFDDDDYITTVWANDTGSDQNVYWVQDGWGTGSGQYTLAWSVVACTNAVAEYNVVPDCGNAQFSVEVNVTDMGSATSLTISDDQGSATQQVMAAGVATFGPYPVGTSIVFTTANDQDANCAITSPTQTYICPPANDECDVAEAFAVGVTAGEIVYDGYNNGATGSAQATPDTCFGYAGGDVWFTIVTPPSGNVIIETLDSTTGGTGVDTVVTVYSGDCSNLTQVSCDDDGADTGAYSKVTVTGQVPGSMLYLRAYEYGNNNFGSFGITAYDESMLGTNPLNDGKFSVYPNPVHNVLNLSYDTNMSNVAVYNLIGQQVISKELSSTAAQVDMSGLATGTYIVKVTADNQVKTIKVVKQ